MLAEFSLTAQNNILPGIVLSTAVNMGMKQLKSRHKIKPA
jgi:hypothetical protein